ncbi:MAG: trigger factor [Verrucomicrobiota bacterium]|nr:trigger factor [Verrucomicrobiota bacterium]
MNLEIKDAGTARKIATVTFDADEIKIKENEACKEIGKIANIPGFRKGKAPANVIRKRFSRELNDELTRKVSTDAYESVLDNKDIKVYSILKVDAGELSSENGASVEVTLDIEPEFEIPDYENFEVTVHSTEVTDDEIDKEINTLRDQRASFDEVDREAKEGDYIKCSYEGELDGKPVAEILPDKPMYGKQTNTWEEAGQAKGLGVDAIAQGVLGMKRGDKKDVEAPFVDDFEISPLAGKTVIYKLEVHEVREKKPPTLNEDFFKSIKVENLEELKDRVLTDLESRKKRDNQNAKRSQVTQKILEIPDFPLPQQAVDDESNSIFQSRAQRAIQQGTKQEEIEAKKDELWKEAKVQGEARVKLTLVLSKIAEKEKVDVNNEDLARAATQEAMMMRKDPTAYIKELSKDRAQLQRLRQDILHDKTLDLIASKAKEKIGEIEEGK